MARLIPGLDLTAPGYLIDLDGTLMSGGRLLAHSRWLLDTLAGRFVIVSNDAEHTPLQMSMGLRRQGITLAASRIILAGSTAIDMLAVERPGARVMVLASAHLRNYARRRGLLTDADACDIVLVGRDSTFTYSKLAAAAAALRAGASLVVANPDGSHPGPTGDPVPETGALAAAILCCAGQRPHRIIGKPQPTLFERGCERLRIHPSAALMIGDNSLTDGAGARAVGMRFFDINADAGDRPLAR